MRAFSDVQSSRKNSGHKSPQTTAGASARSHDGADKREVHIRAIRVQVRGKDAFFGERNLAVRPAAIFDDLGHRALETCSSR
jgi:hypothetical protein